MRRNDHHDDEKIDEAIELPTISLHDISRADIDPEIQRRLFEAFRENHFLIIDDVFTEEEIEKFHHMQRILFDLSTEEKEQHATTTPLQPGFSPYGNAKALDTGIPNLLETWDFPRLDPPMNWPSRLVNELDLLRSIEGRMYDISVTALSGLARSLGDEPDAFLPYIDRRSAGMQLIHYFPIDTEVDLQGARRQSHHTDNTLITIIPPPSAPGLRAQLGTGEWMYVNLQKTQALIQSGRMLQRITGGTISACLHTVDVLSQYRGESRYSSPFFVSVPENVTVSVMASQQTREALERYPAQLAGDIQREYFSSIFGERYKQ